MNMMTIILILLAIVILFSVATTFMTHRKYGRDQIDKKDFYDIKRNQYDDDEASEQFSRNTKIRRYDFQ